MTEHKSTLDRKRAVAVAALAAVLDEQYTRTILTTDSGEAGASQKEPVTKYRFDQPRWPKGNPRGGKWKRVAGFSTLSLFPPDADGVAADAKYQKVNYDLGDDMRARGVTLEDAYAISLGGDEGLVDAKTRVDQLAEEWEGQYELQEDGTYKVDVGERTDLDSFLEAQGYKQDSDGLLWEGVKPEDFKAAAEQTYYTLAAEQLGLAWNSRSNYGLSIHLSDAARRVFGTEGSSLGLMDLLGDVQGTGRLTDPWFADLHVGDLSIYDAYVQAMYDRTQAYFKEQGIDAVELARGIKFYAGDGNANTWQQYFGDGGEGMDVKMRPLSSFSLDVEKAKAFAEVELPGNEGYLQLMTVDVDDILSIGGVTGMGAYSENEMIVIDNGSNTSNVYTYQDVVDTPISPAQKAAGLQWETWPASPEQWIGDTTRGRVAKAEETGTVYTIEKAVTTTTMKALAEELDFPELAEAVEKAEASNYDFVHVTSAGGDINLAPPTGVMVAWFLPEQTWGPNLTVDGGVTDHHLTLCMLGDQAELSQEQQRTLIAVTAEVVQRHSGIHGKVAGTGVFMNPDETVWWAGVQMPGLEALQRDLAQSLIAADLPVEEYSGTYEPHITLAYLPAGTSEPNIDVAPFDAYLGSLTVAIGGYRFDLPLQDVPWDESIRPPEEPPTYTPFIPRVNKAITASQVEHEKEWRYTLGPVYMPEWVDAHGDSIGADELEEAVHDYVRSGDRSVRLQHDKDVVAGEWVGMLVWPWPVTIPVEHEGQIIQKTFPAGTPFMGTVWNEDVWEDVKAGNIRGYSLGGTAQFMTVDFDEDGESDADE